MSEKRGTKYKPEREISDKCALPVNLHVQGWATFAWLAFPFITRTPIACSFIIPVHMVLLKYDDSSLSIDQITSSITIQVLCNLRWLSNWKPRRLPFKKRLAKHDFLSFLPLAWEPCTFFGPHGPSCHCPFMCVYWRPSFCFGIALLLFACFS